MLEAVALELIDLMGHSATVPGALAALGTLEIAGIVRALPGQRYELAARW